MIDTLPKPVPVKNRVIIMRDASDEAVTEVNGIFLYTKQPPKKYTGIVVTLPSVLNNDDCSSIEDCEIKEGDRVMFFPHVTIDFEIDGIEFVSVRYIDILLKF